MDFTERLAKACKLPFVTLLTKKNSYPQKSMANSFYQCKNVRDSFSLISGVENIPKRVILVDDIVDSKWTMTVCGYLLSQAGCEIVFPFALADSSENRRDNFE